jgi:hypothetical protein
MWIGVATLMERARACSDRRNVAERLLVWVAAFALVSSAVSTAQARQSGIESQGCDGCHGNASAPTAVVTTDAMSINPGQVITLTIAVPSDRVAGFYMKSNAVGTFSSPGPGVKLWTDGGVTHSQPGTASGGQTTFRVNWSAPTQPSSGGVDFSVWAVAGNGNGASSGDTAMLGFLSLAYGCGAGTKYYSDFDGDGYGSIDSGYTVNCTKPTSHASMAGDCNDSDPAMHPGAAEICDGKDNNCNGTVDEGLDNAMLCADKDGDGHGVAGGATKIGCAIGKGFGFCDNDCNDNDPTVFPGAVEVCNEKDDNCNRMADERVRPTCGLGWCRRYALSCLGPCIEGPARREECNAFDDDCDGADDNGTDLELCGSPDLGCRDGRCVVIGTGGAGGSGTAGAGGAGTGGGGGVGVGGAAGAGTGGVGGSGATGGGAGQDGGNVGKGGSGGNAGIGSGEGGAPGGHAGANATTAAGDSSEGGCHVAPRSRNGDFGRMGCHDRILDAP